MTIPQPSLQFICTILVHFKQLSSNTKSYNFGRTPRAFLWDLTVQTLSLQDDMDADNTAEDLGPRLAAEGATSEAGPSRFGRQLSMRSCEEERPTSRRRLN
jgi:hypothetical protein